MTSHITDYSFANHKLFLLEAVEKSADLSFIYDQKSNFSLFCQEVPWVPWTVVLLHFRDL